MMIHLLLGVIYLSFISLGLPDSLLGAAWPSMYGEFGVPVSWAGAVSMLIAVSTVVSSLQSDRLTRRLGTGRITAISVAMTALALYGFSVSRSFWMLCVWAVPYGLGAGSVDASLNNYVALHYASCHMSWLHCMWGVGASLGPYIMGYALTGELGWHMGYRMISLLQIALTILLAAALPLWRKGGNKGSREFRVSGIYHCANDMGANLGMSREGYLSIGEDDSRLWCYHYFLSDPSRKQALTEELEQTYGGDVHVHENSWPGLFGIISAMHVLIIFLYGVSAVFVCIVTGMAGARILDTEQKDIGIYKSIGCSVEMLRLSFALRFGLVAAVGAVIGTLAAVCFTDVIVSSVMRLAGISNFASGNTTGSILVPGLAITFLFLWFAWLLAGRIRNPKGYLYGHTT